MRQMRGKKSRMKHENRAPKFQLSRGEGERMTFSVSEFYRSARSDASIGMHLRSLPIDHRSAGRLSGLDPLRFLGLNCSTLGHVFALRTQARERHRGKGRVH